MSKFREQAEAHWKYSEGIIRRCLDLQPITEEEEIIELIRYLYIEGMVHGYKHGKEAVKSAIDP